MNPSPELPSHPAPAQQLRLARLVIGCLAVAASISGIGNQFAQDDLPIIWTNVPVHSLRSIGRLFRESYWPPPFIPSLYRPFATTTLAIEWVIGGGAPVVFRIASYLLYAASCVAVLTLARKRLPFLAAVGVAALFAVHPVHVEAVAAAVNQSELWVGLLSCLAVALYLDGRGPGRPLPARHLLGIAGLYLAACLFKENALVLPGLLVAAELLLIESDEPARRRIAQGRLPLLVLLLVALSFYGVRTRVFSGDLVAAYPAEALIGLKIGGRALTMLAVVPHWFRLLFWPAHLQVDYSPSEIVAQTSWGPDQTLGALLLAGGVLVFLLARRRAPMISFGIAWCALGLFPVHNVLVPTGIVLAERTLFLPSIGAVLILGGLGAALLSRVGTTGRRVLGTVTGGLLLAGMLRSATRHPVWSDQFNLWFTTANKDAPRSFRAHEALAESYFGVGVEAMAEAEYRLAIRYAPPTFNRPRQEFADRLRTRGFCYPAIDLYKYEIALQPNHLAARAGLIACFLHLGWYREAIVQARLGSSYDSFPREFRAAREVAESALRVGAPPGTVRVPAPADSSQLTKYFLIGHKP